MPKREDERWAGEREGAAKCCPSCKRYGKFYYNKKLHVWACGWCERYFPDLDPLTWSSGEEALKHRGARRKIKLGRWLLALVGIVLLGGGVAYFPSFAAFLEDRGVTNRAFVSSLELPIEAFGAWLILLALFARRPAKTVKVSVVLLFLAVSTLFVWHTPSLKGQASNIVISWRQRVAGASQGATPAATPTPTPAPKSAASATASTPKSVEPVRLELLIHQQVNEQRRKYGLPPLTYDERLAVIARRHSEDMARFRYFSHTNLIGEGPSDRAQRQGYVCRKDYGTYYTEGVAENIFQGWLYSSITYIGPIPIKNWYSTEELAKVAVDEWMDSPGHRANILDRQYDREGIGVAVSSDEKVLVTQNFC